MSRMRERVQGEGFPPGLLDVTYKRELNDGSTDTQYWTETVTGAIPPGDISWMRDHVGSKRRRGAWPNRPCEQRTRGSSMYPTGKKLVWSKDTDPDQTWGHNNADVMTVVPLVPIKPLDSPMVEIGAAIPNLNSRIASHQNKIRNWVIPKRFSLINFLWELQDLGRLYKLVSTRIYSTADRLLTRVIQESTGEGANIVLNYEYGVAPMLSDLSTMADLLANMYNRAYKLAKESGRATIRSNYRDTLSDATGPELPTTTTFNSPNVDAKSFRRNMEVHARLGFCTRVTYGPKEFGLSVVEDTKRWLRAFGISNPFKVVWNAMPFSFLADRFLQTNRIFDRLDLDTADYRITSNCSHYTVTQECERRLIVQGLRRFQLYVDYEPTLAKAFRRWEGYPSAPDLVNQGPETNWEECLTLLSLVRVLFWRDHNSSIAFGQLEQVARIFWKNQKSKLRYAKRLAGGRRGSLNAAMHPWVPGSPLSDSWLSQLPMKYRMNGLIDLGKYKTVEGSLHNLRDSLAEIASLCPNAQPGVMSRVMNISRRK